MEVGQWNKPANTGPDKECPGFLVNLGPTGARAILKETSFVVKYVFPKSPADGRLRIDDEITGVNGQPFHKHTFGKCYSMEPGAGYEGPIMDMGTATRGLLEYNKAFINMARTHDGAFVIQPGRNLHEMAYYLSPRIHPTAAMVLALWTDTARLRIQGVHGKPQSSILKSKG